MDRRDREREMASNLLSELHPRVITDDQVGVDIWNKSPSASMVSGERRGGGEMRGGVVLVMLLA
jgi:hypothetical protein